MEPCGNPVLNVMDAMTDSLLITLKEMKQLTASYAGQTTLCLQDWAMEGI